MRLAFSGDACPWRFVGPRLAGSVKFVFCRYVLPDLDSCQFVDCQFVSLGFRRLGVNGVVNLCGWSSRDLTGS